LRLEKYSVTLVGGGRHGNWIDMGIANIDIILTT
jgi:hypothetical protein